MKRKSDSHIYTRNGVMYVNLSMRSATLNSLNKGSESWLDSKIPARSILAIPVYQIRIFKCDS